MYQANQRQGSHQTKIRGEVAGTTKKMYRQKGTGNARAGSTAERHPPRRRSHLRQFTLAITRYRLPRKALQLATRMALAAKVRDDEVIVIDELDVRRAEDARTWRRS